MSNTLNVTNFTQIKSEQFPRWKKVVIGGLLLMIVAAPVSGLTEIFSSRKAAALSIPGLGSIGIPIPGTEETTEGLDCGLFGSILGTCVPIKVDADPYRTKRNITKGILTPILMAVSKTIAVWLANKIDNAIKINDYLGYFKLVSDALYTQRFIFDKFGIPEDRMLANITFNDQYRGGTNFQTIMATLTNKANIVKNKPLITGQTAPFNPTDPLWYAQLAVKGSWLSEPADWNHVFNDIANETRSSSQQAASMEILTSNGYKATRNDQDLNNILQQKTIAYYTGNNNNRIPIRTPGGYAAMAISKTIEKVLGTQSPYNQTNITAAIVADLVGSLINGTIFRGGTQTPGVAANNDYTGNNATAPGQPGTSGGIGSSVSGGNPPCIQDTNSDGILDSPQPCTPVGSAISGGGTGGTNTPTAPTIVSYSGATGTTLNISWQPVVGATSYTVTATDPSGNTFTCNAPLNVTTCTLTGLTPSTAYVITVVASNVNGSSPPSTPITATTTNGGPVGGLTPPDYSVDRTVVNPTTCAINFFGPGGPTSNIVDTSGGIATGYEFIMDGLVQQVTPLLLQNLNAWQVVIPPGGSVTHDFWMTAIDSSVTPTAVSSPGQVITVGCP